MVNKKKIKIFITGHKGMVGSSLLRFFKKKKFGNLLYATRLTLNLENPVKVNNYIKKHKPDVIVNCAGKVGGILANSTYPTEFLNENILIQTNLIKSAYKNNISHFINLGSSCIYPKYSEQPIKENYLLSGSLEKTNEAYAIAQKRQDGLGGRTISDQDIENIIEKLKKENQGGSGGRSANAKGGTIKVYAKGGGVRKVNY